MPPFISKQIVLYVDHIKYQALKTVVATWKYLVWKRVKAQPILRSNSCRASTDKLSLIFGRPRLCMADLISFSVSAEKCALEKLEIEKTQIDLPKIQQLEQKNNPHFVFMRQKHYFEARGINLMFTTIHWCLLIDSFFKNHSKSFFLTYHASEN